MSEESPLDEGNRNSDLDDEWHLAFEWESESVGIACITDRFRVSRSGRLVKLEEEIFTGSEYSPSTVSLVDGGGFVVCVALAIGPAFRLGCGFWVNCVLSFWNCPFSSLGAFNLPGPNFVLVGSCLRSSKVFEDSAPATEGFPTSGATDLTVSAFERMTQGPYSAGSHSILPPGQIKDSSLALPKRAHCCTSEMSEPPALQVEETPVWSKSPSRPSEASGWSPVCIIFKINISIFINQLWHKNPRINFRNIAHLIVVLRFQ